MDGKRSKESAEQLSLLERAMAASSCGITIADAQLPDMPLIFVNAAFERITGYSADDILGKNCRFLQGDDPDPETRSRIREALDKREHLTVLLKNFRKDGTMFWNELTLSPIFDRQGNATHFVGIQDDVTEREESRRQLARQQKALEETVDELKEAHRERDKMMGAVAHDLRGPLGSIRSLAEMALDGDMAETEEILQTMVDTADRSLVLVNDLVDFSAIRSGRLEIKKEQVDLPALLKQFEKSAALSARRKDISFTLSQDLPEKMQIEIDSHRFNQIIDNLFTNAVKFSESGSSVELQVEREGDEIIFRMIDEGPGIPEEEMPKLFKAFEKTSAAPTGGESSSGLGLSIVKQLVERHDGTISVRSQPGQGSTFEVRLPCAGS